MIAPRIVATLAALLLAACTGTPSSTEGAQSSTVGAGGSGASGGAGPGGSSEGGALPLVDEGLVVRYFIDEEASGQGPSALIDAAPEPLALPLTYTPEMVFVDKNGHRGLEFTQEGLDGRASIAVDGTKIQDQLAGSLAATIEAVVEIAAVSPSGSRIVHVGFDTEWWFTMGSTNPNRVLFDVQNADLGIYVTPLPLLGRVVLQAVLDNSQADSTERARLYVNGGPAPSVGGMPMGMNAAIDIPSGKHFALGNREIGQRTIRGVLYYAAVYRIALSQEQLEQNARSLLRSDDTP